MKVGHDPGDRANLIVGASPAEAASVFGRYLPAADITTYADFGEDVDLGLLGSLGLVAGTGLGEVLPSVLEQQSTPGPSAERVLLGISAETDAADSIRQAMRAHPSLALLRVGGTYPTVLLEVVPRQERAGEILPDSLADPDFLRRLDNDPDTDSATAPADSTTSRHPAAPQAAPEHSPPEEPGGLVTRLTRRVGGRRQLLVAAVAVAGLLLLIALTLAGALWGATGVLILLGLLTVMEVTGLAVASAIIAPRLLRSPDSEGPAPTHSPAAVPPPAPQTTAGPGSASPNKLTETAADRVLALSRLISRSEARARGGAGRALGLSGTEEFLLSGLQTVLQEHPAHVLGCCSAEVAAVMNVTIERHLPATQFSQAATEGAAPVDLLLIDDDRPETLAAATSALGPTCSVVVHVEALGAVAWFRASTDFDVVSVDDHGLRLRVTRRPAP